MGHYLATNGLNWPSGDPYLAKASRFRYTQAMTRNHAHQPQKRQRLRIPQLKWSHDRGWHVNFTNALGKPDRHRFEVPKDPNKDNEARAKNQWRLWVVRNIPEAARLPEFADLAEVAQAPARWAGTGEVSDRPSSLVIMPSVIQAFIESERARVRPSGAEYREGSIQAKHFENGRHILLQLGFWAKRHFGDRFLTVPFGDLWAMQDYRAMMAYFTTQVEHAKGTGKNAKVVKGYSPMYLKVFRTLFWRLASFAEDYPYEQRLRFTREKANRDARFAMRVKARPKVFPDLPTLKRILAFASTEQRAWIWIALGCGFEPIGLAQATRRCFDQEMYDLTRSKTELLRRGKMRPIVWAHIQAYLREKPRGEDELLFVTRNGLPLVERADKTKQELQDRPTKGLHKENNALLLAWTRLLNRAGTKWRAGFRILRSVACTVMTKRPNIDMQELWDFMGHAPNSDTWKHYAQYVTPASKPMIEWVRRMLDSADPDAWRDDEVRQYEEECHQRREQAKENSKRWRDRNYPSHRSLTGDLDGGDSGDTG